MTGLFDGIRVASKTLFNLQTAMSVVGENIANSNTPGFSRKRVEFASSPVQIFPFGALGSGSDIVRIESVRDDLVERRLLTELQSQGELEGRQFGLEQVEALLGDLNGSGLGDQLSRFFNSFLELAADPSSPSLRQAALLEAENMASAFSQQADRLAAIEASNRAQIADSVTTINSLLNRIADLNQRIDPLNRQGVDAGALVDERQVLLQELSTELGIQTFETSRGELVVTTLDGRLLVSGSRSNLFTFSQLPNSVSLQLGGEDVTGEPLGGRLQGLFEFQNTDLPGFQNSLNALVEEFVTQVNTIHNAGTAVDGSSGLDLFSFTAGSAAATISVNIQNADSLATGTGGGPGDGTAAQQIADLRDQKFASTGEDTFSGFFAQMVTKVGVDVRAVQNGLTAQDRILQQVRSERDAVSGVSLDEEAVQLLQLQRAFQANSRMIQLLNELLEETMNLVR